MTKYAYTMARQTGEHAGRIECTDKFLLGRLWNHVKASPGVISCDKPMHGHFDFQVADSVNPRVVLEASHEALPVYLAERTVLLPWTVRNAPFLWSIVPIVGISLNAVDAFLFGNGLDALKFMLIAEATAVAAICLQYALRRIERHAMHMVSEKAFAKLEERLAAKSDKEAPNGSPAQ